MRRVLNNALLTLVLGALCVAALAVFNRLAAPRPRVLPPTGVQPPDYAALAATVTEEALRKDIETLCKDRPLLRTKILLRGEPAPQGRFSGSPGCADAAQFIRETLKQLGYAVMDQPFVVTAPKTVHAEIGPASDPRVGPLRLYPLLPNWFRTPSTPPEGLRGVVYRGEKGLAREFQDVDLRGNVALLPLGAPWATVAAMGAVAVLYYDDGRKTIPARWDHHVDASVDVPRFFVQGKAEALAGARVELKARVDLAEQRVSNLIAILPAREGEAPAEPSAPASPGSAGASPSRSPLSVSDEAIVVHAFYDAYSHVPDLAPGAQQACGTAALLSLARHLAAEANALKRSVVLVATAGHGQGLAGMREFLQALGVRERRADALAEALAEERRLAEDVGRLDDWMNGWVEEKRGIPAITQSSGARESEKSHTEFEELIRAALQRELVRAVERVVQARVDWVRDGMRVHDAAGAEASSFLAYNAARKRQLAVQSAIATPPQKLLGDPGSYLAVHGMQEDIEPLAAARGQELRRRHAEARARVELAKALAPYQRLLFLGLDLTARSGRVGLVCGQAELTSACMPADAELVAQFQRAAEELQKVGPKTGYASTKQGQPRFVNLVRENDVRDLPFVTEAYGAPFYFESLAALWGGHTAFTLATLDDNRERMGTPSDTLDALLGGKAPAAGEELALANLCGTTRLVAAVVSQLARGYGRLVPVARASDLYTVRGRVVSQIGDSLTPNHPMPGALVRFGPVLVWGAPRIVPPGVGSDLVVTADERGRFALPAIWPSALSHTFWYEFDLDAAAVRPDDGQVTWALSIPKSGEQGAYRVRNVKIGHYRKSRATAVVFRAAPVQLVPMPNPTTLRPYARLDFVETKSLAAPAEFKVEAGGGATVCFVPPESRLFFTFKEGKRTNPNLMEIRAFALGAAGPADGSGQEGQDLAGRGYLAADTPAIPNVELDAALSMAQVNARRVRLQERHGMADEMVLAYGQRAVALADEAEALAEAGRLVEAKRTACASLAYSANIHPVIRKNASDAVVGILFYLVLAIPFALFAEKLLVGHPDLRCQIAFQAAIFILFFGVLWAMHPAMELVRSPSMILLGFITFGLAVVVSGFVAGRFWKNVAELNRRFQERAEVADVSRAGAAATAFLLGLSNLRKRPVRTGLTIGVLILTTFVLLCFASVSTDRVDIEFPLGKAAYTGLLVRDRHLRDVGPSVAPLRELYGEKHLVAPREWAGNFTVPWGKAPELAQITVSRALGETSCETTANAVLGLSCHEPKATPVQGAFEVLRRWFESESEETCFLPRPMADQLRVDDEEVRRGTATVKIGGRPYTVLGVFDPARLDALADLDGQPLLPADIVAMRRPDQPGGRSASDEATEIPEDIPRLPAARVVITPPEAMPSRAQTGSVAVTFQGTDYRSARDLITTHLERSAEPSYYGLDGVAFYGGKFRMQSLEGTLDLVLPLVIAALTVLNTMGGSVYERRTELYVFNAVGLSPSHIRWLFLAEACVYAVVGVVGGYGLAQGAAAGLKACGLRAGLTMNYSSLASVVVSLHVMGVVLLSSLYPAWMAARLAAPAESMVRKRETAAGDTMELDLPFTFNRRDRVAIIPYFLDWFDNYGEGSAGAFFCSPPRCGIRAEPDASAAPFVETTTWLKPYDLGVSQSVELVVRRATATGDNVATVVMTRKSGDRESWERCNHAFIGLLRKRFLTWRAIPNEERARLLERGRRLLEQAP